jgi:hypothetical protein
VLVVKRALGHVEPSEDGAVDEVIDGKNLHKSTALSIFRAQLKLAVDVKK